jgi:hypothetical protein
MLADWAVKKSRKNSASGSLLPWLVRTICVGRGEMGARGPAASAAGPPSAQGTVAMAKIQSEVIVAIIAALVAVAVWRVARNPQLAVLAIAMLYVVARSVIARAFQE